MTRPKSSKPPAAWRQLRDLSPEGKAFTAAHPALYLHLWCNFSGVHLTAHVDHLDRSGRLCRTEIARASWKPAEVTEVKCVEWAQRALTRWLESQSTPG